MKKFYLQFYIYLFCFLFTFISSAQNEIQRVRIDFETPTGFTRHLMLGFTPDNAASDDFDYGYDGLNIENLPDDLNWIIDEERYVIQGVGAFNISKCYPLGMFLTNSGTVNISLAALENFDTSINVFIYDHLLGTFESINTSNYSNTLNNGDYVNRFFITFTNNITQIEFNEDALSVESFTAEQISLKYLKSTSELVINSNNSQFFKELTLFNSLAQKVYSNTSLDTNKLIIPLQNIASNTFIIKLINQDNNVIFKQIILR